MAWITPKTNWKGTDRFTASDWNRIVGNLKVISDRAGIPYEPLDTIANGDVLSSEDRNIVTNLIEQIYFSLSSSWNRGYVYPRVAYGSAWGSKELNIIETTINDLKRQLDGELNNEATIYSGEIISGELVSIGLL